MVDPEHSCACVSMYRWMDGYPWMIVVSYTLRLMGCHILLLDEKVFVKIIVPPSLFSPSTLVPLKFSLPLIDHFRPPIQLFQYRKEGTNKPKGNKRPLSAPLLSTPSTFSLHSTHSKTLLLSLSFHSTHNNTMHSKLDLHKHVSCEDIILQLDQCHNEGILHRYLGGCNKLKNAMNDCLQAEVKPPCSPPSAFECSTH